MRLTEIELVNFRCFEHLAITLDPKLNVVVGINGSGKSSLLKGINLALAAPLMQTQLLDYLPFDKENIRISFVDKSPVYQTKPNPSITAKAEWNGNKLTWSRTKTSTSNEKKTFNELDSLAEQFKTEYGDPCSNYDFPVLAYYGPERISRDRKANSRKDLPKLLRLLGYYNALTDSSTSKFLYDWYSDEINLERETKDEKRDFGYQSDTLFQIRDSMQVAFEIMDMDVLNLIYFENKQYPEFEDIHLVLNYGRQIPVSQLSDGLKNLFWIVFDLTYRCVKLNPQLGLKARTQSKGVVTIDELDMYFHPKVQASIVALLQKLFPQIQFIVTTHSPLLIGSVRHQNLVILKDFQKVGVPDDPFGKSVHEILEGLMDAPIREARIARMLETYFKAIREHQWDTLEAKNLQKELENELGVGDVELANADFLIKLYQEEGDETHS